MFCTIQAAAAAAAVVDTAAVSTSAGSSARSCAPSARRRPGARSDPFERARRGLVVVTAAVPAGVDWVTMADIEDRQI
jgi:hypothetical protein